VLRNHIGADGLEVESSGITCSRAAPGGG
jgi:hypothetical protein